MSKFTPTERRLARNCLKCPVCNHVRRKQRGLAFWFVRKVEAKFCPQCRAYAKVYGRMPHEPLAGGSREK